MSKIALTVPIWIAIGSLILAAATPAGLAPKVIPAPSHPDSSPRIATHLERSDREQSPTPEHSQSRDGDSVHPRPVPFETIPPAFGHAPIGVTEINDPATWSSFWQQNPVIFLINTTTGSIIVSPTPEIDFDHHTVLVASPGMEGNPGVKFSINQVTRGGDQIIVGATLTTPGLNCVWIQVVTFPEQIIIIPKTDTPAILNVNTVQGPPCPF